VARGSRPADGGGRGHWTALRVGALAEKNGRVPSLEIQRPHEETTP